MKPQELNQFAVETMKFLSTILRTDKMLFYTVDRSADGPIFVPRDIDEDLMTSYMSSMRDVDPFNTERVWLSGSSVEVASKGAARVPYGERFMDFFSSYGFGEIVELFFRDAKRQLRGGLSIPLTHSQSKEENVRRVVSDVANCHRFIEFNFVSQRLNASDANSEWYLNDFPLSKRETQIAKLIADGRSNQEISEALCISLATVKSHLNNIFGKVQVTSRTALAAKILRQAAIH
ncbi:TPA: helix-turn-helix transcriptional regulator [Burkholderia cenocepacia]|uniref:helix-turn-helix transcriptional regulator n=1 Tax=Burkholderia cepacia complex TaxID=87882 RepID=UPI0009C2BA46|nr:MULTISPECIES: helix-turn-helix transcriptional regulator [Burkholderia cepacia complex]AQT53753.1 hypothetical protein BHQ31_27715 [Burkholderia cenocepacia]HEM7902025.1 helix-turn-helix transcriptional regulator [Burkholderia cenocepacia]